MAYNKNLNGDFEMTDCGKLPNLTFPMQYTFDYIVHNTVDVMELIIQVGWIMHMCFSKKQMSLGQVPPTKEDVY